MGRGKTLRLTELIHVLRLGRLPVLLPAFNEIDAVDKAPDRFGRLLAPGDGLHRRGRARDDIAAGKDLLDVGLQRDRIDGQAVAPDDIQLAGAVEAGQIGLLADGRDGAVDLDDVLRALDRHRAPAARHPFRHQPRRQRPTAR